ncbi:hypothetical protein [Streptomyces sp. NBC_00140]|uniref:hypothetical protein n=1 Tax=Streptomyces sp. NBC_00140 TaxID=2975664 RepID=UPI00224DE0EF|nr:hypothetical protein [Streptomyces sp. NBC_00140]MCX5336853.1 hypothetical protein [Streptomyces sp. NBC_00140]
MQSAIPAPLSARAADARLSPAYYVRADGLGPYITDLLENCRSVFDKARHGRRPRRRRRRPVGCG